MMIDYPKLMKDHEALVARAGGVRDALAVLHRNGPDSAMLAFLAQGFYDDLPAGGGSMGEVAAALAARRESLTAAHFTRHSATLIEQDVLLGVFQKFQQLTLHSHRAIAAGGVPDADEEKRDAARRIAAQSEQNVARTGHSRAFTQASIRAVAERMAQSGIGAPAGPGASADGIAFVKRFEPLIRPGMPDMLKADFLEQVYYHLAANADRAAAEMLDMIHIDLGVYHHHEAAGGSFLRKRLRHAMPKADNALALAGRRLNEAAGALMAMRIGSGIIQQKIAPGALRN